MNKLILTLVVAVVPAAARAFQLPLHDSRRDLRDLIAAKHSDALDDVSCGKGVAIDREKGISCPDEKGQYRVVLPADALRAGDFDIGMSKDGRPHVAKRGSRGFNVAIQTQEIARMVEDVQKDEQRAREREAIQRYAPIQGNYSIEDLFNAFPR